MQTVQRALSLLEHFSELQPSLGLTEISKLAGLDKATTRRLLVGLMSRGFVEQDAHSKRYALGAALLRLARIREATQPIQTIVDPILQQLSDALNETAHFSLFSGNTLGTVGVVEPARANRVILNDGEILPVHASASGLAFLAWASPEIGRRILGGKLKAYTEETLVSAADLRCQLQQIREQGFVVSSNGYEDGVCGVAAPVFTAGAYASGAISIAGPTSRMLDIDLQPVADLVMTAAAQIAQKLGVHPPGVGPDACEGVA